MIAPAPRIAVKRLASPGCGSVGPGRWSGRVVLCGSRTESGDSEQIVGGSYAVGMQLGTLEDSIARTTLAAGGLHPAEDPLDPFAHPLGEP